MLQTTKRIIHEDVTSTVAKEEYGKTDILAAYDNFWHYRVVINPRLTLRKMWFPRSLSLKLRKFWEEFKAGKRPVMLLIPARALPSGKNVWRTKYRTGSHWDNGTRKRAHCAGGFQVVFGARALPARWRV